MSATNYLEKALVNQIFRGVAFTFPTTLYVGLGTTASNEDGINGEVSTSGTNYDRVPIACNTSNWEDPNNLTGGGLTHNLNEVAYGAPSADWGTVISCGLFDQQTGGNCLFYGALDQQRQILTGDPAPKFLAEELDVVFD